MFCSLKKDSITLRRSLEGRRRRKKEVKQKNKDMKANKTIYLAEAAAPESGEGRKADILAKLAAAFDVTNNKCIAITLNNYLHTAEGIAAEEFTEKIYNWYLDALKNFGFSFEAAAPGSGEAAEETAAEYQEAAADLVKTAAAVVVGFFGFYLTFAIFGI